MAASTTIQVVGVVHLLLLAIRGSSSLTDAALLSTSSTRSSSVGKRVDNSNPFPIPTNFPTIFQNSITPSAGADINTGNLIYNTIAFPQNSVPYNANVNIREPGAHFSLMHFAPQNFIAYESKDHKFNGNSFPSADRRDSGISKAHLESVKMLPSQNSHFRHTRQHDLGTIEITDRKLFLNPSKFQDSHTSRIAPVFERDVNENSQSLSKISNANNDVSHSFRSHNSNPTRTVNSDSEPNFGGSHTTVFRTEERLAPTIFRSIPYSTYEERKVTPLSFNPFFLRFSGHDSTAQVNLHVPSTEDFDSLNDASINSQNSPLVSNVNGNFFSPGSETMKQNVPSSMSNTLHSVDANGENVQANSINVQRQRSHDDVRNRNRGMKLVVDEQPNTKLSATNNFPVLTNDQKGVVASHSHIGKFSQNPILNQPVGFINRNKFLERLHRDHEFSKAFASAGLNHSVGNTKSRNKPSEEAKINHSSSHRKPVSEGAPKITNISHGRQIQSPRQGSLHENDWNSVSSNTSPSNTEEKLKQNVNIFKFGRGLDNNEPVYWRFPDSSKKNQGKTSDSSEKEGDSALPDQKLFTETSLVNFSDVSLPLHNRQGNLPEIPIVQTESTTVINFSTTQSLSFDPDYETVISKEPQSSGMVDGLHSLFTDKSVHDIHAKNIQKVSSLPDVQKPTIIKLTGIPLNSQFLFATKESKDQYTPVSSKATTSMESFSDKMSNAQVLPKLSFSQVESSVKKLPPQKRCYYTSHTWMCPPQHFNIHSGGTSQKLTHSSPNSNTENPSVFVKQEFGNNFQGYSAISRPREFSEAFNAKPKINTNTDLPNKACTSENCKDSVYHTNEAKVRTVHDQLFHQKAKHVSSSSELSDELDVELQKAVQSSVVESSVNRIETPKFGIQPDKIGDQLKNGVNLLTGGRKFGQTHLSHKKQNPDRDRTDPKCSHSFHDYLCSENESNFENTANPNIGKSVLQDFNPITESKLEAMTELSTTTHVPPTILVVNHNPEIDLFHIKSNVEPVTRPFTSSYQSPDTHNFVTNAPPFVISTSPTSETENPTVTKPSDQFDRCLHPFHAWLCQKPIRNRLSSLAVPSNFHTTPKVEQVDNPELFNSDTKLILSTNDENVTLAHSGLDPHRNNDPVTFINTQTERNTLNTLVTFNVQTTTSRIKSNLCENPFHSWMCFHGQPKKSETTFSRTPIHEVRDKKLASSDSSRKPEIVSPFSDPDDPCSHSFHSWLCKLNRDKDNQSSNEQSHSTQVSLFLRNNVISSTNRPIELNPRLSNQKPEGETPKKQVGTSGLTENESNERDHRTFDANDPCSHPFHSHLCNRVPTTNSPPTQNVLPILEPIPVPSGAHTKENIRRPKSGERPHKNHISNKCSHPFHSWLCAVAQKLGSDDSRSLSAIDSLIDSDRFLLKTSNLPNIRQLPLETGDSTSGISDFPESNPLKAAQLTYSTQHWENLKADRQESLQTTTHFPSPRVTPSPSVPSIGSKIIPTLPSLIPKEHSVSTPNPTSHSEFSFVDSRGHFSTSSFSHHPQDSFHNPNPINFSNHKFRTDPPRATRDTNRGVLTKTKQLRKLAREVTHTDGAHTKRTPNLSALHREIPPSIVSDAILQQRDKDIKMEGGFSPSSHFGVHHLYPSPFMQFPSITSEANSPSNKMEPVVIIDSHFPDSVPSSTMSEDDSINNGNFARVKVSTAHVRNYRDQKSSLHFQTKKTEGTRVNSPNFSISKQTDDYPVKPSLSQYQNPTHHHQSPIPEVDSMLDDHLHIELLKTQSRSPVGETEKVKPKSSRTLRNTAHKLMRHKPNIPSERGPVLSTSMIFKPSARDGGRNPVNFVPSTFSSMANARAKITPGRAKTRQENPGGISETSTSTLSTHSAFHASSNIASEDKRIANNVRNVNFSFKFPDVPNPISREVRAVNHYVSQPLQRGVLKFARGAASEPAAFLLPPPVPSGTETQNARLQAHVSKFSFQTDRTRRKSGKRTNSGNRVLFQQRVRS